MKMVIIRPQPGADNTAKKAIQAGFTPIVMPMFVISKVAWIAPEPSVFDAILITSANALRHGGAALDAYHSLPAFAAGKTSAAAARDAGFSVAGIGRGGGVEALTLAVRSGFHRILWLSGADAMALMPPAGIQLVRHIVYRSAALNAPSDFAEILQQPDIIAVLHSARAAAHFSDQCELKGVIRSNIVVAALSAAVAAAAGNGWRSIAAAHTPNDAALMIAAMDAAKSCFTNSPHDPYC